ncbi:hypothetical protein EHM76_01665 [bacterium]|nr:MAG: hypothetical protein EHM76_01665 [bacterium]
MNATPKTNRNQAARKFLAGILLLAGLTILFVSGCAAADSASQAVEGYLQALVENDGDRMVNLSCADWEDDARLDLDAFMGVTAHLENVACQAGETSSDTAAITCTGQIVASYNGEAQSFDISGRTFQVVQEAGAWRMCGYR